MLQDIEPTAGNRLYDVSAPAATAPADSAPARRLAIVPKDPQSTKPPVAGARMERRTVPDDDDQATAETISMMCDYIRAGVKDPLCVAWAEWALDCFGMGVDDARAKFWAVFWCLKHAVKYRRDEPELFRIGERSARDLLTAPSVLVRQAAPAEDCDGFTMLACTLLQILGVPAFIVTAKVDPGEPGRWSHVFAMADVAGVGLCSLDGSHGKAPGWMVPRSHIFGYQVWDLNGRPIHKKLPVVQPRLQGYEYRPRGMGAQPGAVRRRRGVGDTCAVDPTTGVLSDLTTGLPCGTSTGPLSALPSSGVCVNGFDTGSGDPCLAPTGPPAVITPIAGTPAPNPANVPTATPSTLQSIINNLFGAGTKIATIATAPAGSTISPTGAVTIGGAPLMASLGNLLPWLLVGGVILFAVNAASSAPSRGRH